MKHGIRHGTGSKLMGKGDKPSKDVAPGFGGAVPAPKGKKAKALVAKKAKAFSALKTGM